jgi:hypothetical protein
VPVYNVSYPLLSRLSPDRPFFLTEIDAPAPAAIPAEPRPVAATTAS